MDTPPSSRGPARPVAVLCAIEAEMTHLRAMLPPGTEEWHGPRRFHRTRHRDLPVVLGLCGIGMLSAAAVTEALIQAYAPAAVLNYGCSGAHRDDLLPGDLVIGARVIAYDNVRIGPEGHERYAGMRYLYRDEQRRGEYLSADPALLAAAQAAAATLDGRHEPWPLGPTWPSEITHRPPHVAVGTVSSADRWNRVHERIRSLAGTYESLCEDMEAGAIALTCASHDVPFLTVKDISNNELLRFTADSRSFRAETEGQLGKRAAALVLATLTQLAAATSAA